MNTRTEGSSSRLSRRLLIFVWAALLMGTAGAKAEPVKTLVQDTLYRADGSVAHGKVSIRWSGFSTSVGEAVAAGEMTVATDANGGISIPLIANTGSVPSGGYYKVVIKLDDGTTSEEIWVVPTAASTTVAAIRAKVMPKAVAAQFVSRDYVDTALGTLAANPTVHLSGAESIQGAKTFLVSPEMPVPTDAGGARNKGYVDQQVSGLSVNLASPGAVGSTTPGTVNATGYWVNGLPLSSRNLGDGATLPQLDGGGKLAASAIPNNTANTTGNAGTATALASAPAQCTSGQFSTGVTVSGVANCTPVAYAQLSAPPLIPNLNTPGPIGTNAPNTVNATNITTSGNVAVSAMLSGQNFRSTFDVAMMTGVDFGQKVAACIAMLPTGGGICDARGINGNQTLSANLSLASNVALLLSNINVTQGTYQVLFPVGVQNVVVSCEGGYSYVGTGAFAGCFFGYSGTDYAWKAPGDPTGTTWTRQIRTQDIGIRGTADTVLGGMFLGPFIDTVNLVRPRISMGNTTTIGSSLVLNGGNGVTTWSANLTVDQPEFAGGIRGLWSTSSTAPGLGWNASRVNGGRIQAKGRTWLQTSLGNVVAASSGAGYEPGDVVTVSDGGCKRFCVNDLQC